MRTLVLAAVAGLALGGAYSPLTARQVVEKNLAARGGAKAFAAVHSLSFRGHLDLGPQGPAPLSVWITTEPARIRVELTLPQGKMVQGFDGQTAWMQAPGQTTTQVLSGAEAISLRDQALGGVDLMCAAAARPELVGTGKRDGHDYYEVRFTLPTGDSFTQYVDSHSWLAFHEEYPGGVEEIGDYRRSGGLLLPMRYVSGPAGKPGTPLVREQITLNPTIAAAMFSKP